MVLKVMQAVDELIEREPYEPKHPMDAGHTTEKLKLYDRAEAYYRKALALVPNRPDALYLLAQNLVVQGKMQEAEEPLAVLLEQSKEIPKAGVLYGVALMYAPEEYRGESFAVFERSLRPEDMWRLSSTLPAVRMIYNDFVAKFIKSRDEKNFLTALETAIRIEEA